MIVVVVSDAPRLFLLLFPDGACSLRFPVLLTPRRSSIGRPNDADGLRGGDDRGRRIEEQPGLFYHVIELVHRVVSRLYIHLVLHDL